ncbi:hypothetical protein HYX05_00235 [Candidatus Woesearchaeota archaeon]|nr:hypothetical protein [Candidatus Woesearchaeota archaeon]
MEIVTKAEAQRAGIANLVVRSAGLGQVRMEDGTPMTGMDYES